MRTITFYSYKGGVGRSLLVANAAMYLSTLGKKVFALDLDLEAPGLHYKFELRPDSARSDAAAGVVDILVDFLKDGSLPESLADHAPQLMVAIDAGAIHVMRAGTAPHGDYWRTLSQINWYDLFYGPEPVGAPFFLELKERIRRDFSPDFLLIDARTGITEMGGVATTLLADTVVCLGLVSVEHLEGLRAVMQGIKQTTSRQGRSSSVDIVPVVSRLPLRRDSVIEDGELNRIRSFLNASSKEGVAGLDLDEVLTLHSEPLLDSEEQLLVGGKNSPGDLPLLRDYLRLFSKIIPPEDIRPHVGQLIRQATSRLLDDPDAAQSDLEALTTYCADPEAYRALLKVYQLRKAPLDKIVATAALMWQLSPSSSRPDQFLVDVVKIAFAEPRATDVQKKHADFAEAIWRSSGMKDIRVGMTLVNAYLPERRERAVRLLSDYVERADPPDSVAVVRLIDMLRIEHARVPAFSIVERYKGTAVLPAFHAAWARLVVDLRDSALAQQALQDPLFSSDAVRAEDPATLYRLLKLAGDEASVPFLEEAIERALVTEDLPRLRDLAEVMHEEGRLREFEIRVRNRIPASAYKEIADNVERRSRRSRLLGR